MYDQPAGVAGGIVITKEQQAMLLLADGASGDKEMEELFIHTFITELLPVFKDRQRKYGRGNIAKHGGVGVHVRTDDKSCRLDNFYFGDTEDFADETPKDSWIDRGNYGIIGLMCFLGIWPGCPEEKQMERLAKTIDKVLSEKEAVTSAPPAYSTAWNACNG